MPPLARVWGKIFADTYSITHMRKLPRRQMPELTTSVDWVNQPLPPARLFQQLFAAGGTQPVISGPPVVIRRAPERYDPASIFEPVQRGIERTVRTPDVVEFAVSPQVGQAVLAFARSYSSSGPNSVRADRRAPPAPPAKLSPLKGMAQPIFPARLKLRGHIRSSDRAPGRAPMFAE